METGSTAAAAAAATAAAVAAVAGVTGTSAGGQQAHHLMKRVIDSKPPQECARAVPSPKPNQVGTVLLYGIPIVSLYIESQERLCLAQISNTLLKQFSYNEIHNRRVALGITCVQCTPVQLEILRRAGAMPVSSRRCGMITRREAERLCKSFLGDNAPPRLPEDFAFSVHHECAWGCRGSFLPSRYNSSRAKCIKCSYCGLFFSPNKFIFHSHRIGPGDKYIQPDAANFNSWRRHMKLSGNPPEEIIYAWEDVKAMFNGGTRKRLISNSPSSSHHNHHHHHHNHNHHHHSSHNNNINNNNNNNNSNNNHNHHHHQHSHHHQNIPSPKRIKETAQSQSTAAISTTTQISPPLIHAAAAAAVVSATAATAAAAAAAAANVTQFPIRPMNIHHHSTSPTAAAVAAAAAAASSVTNSTTSRIPGLSGDLTLPFSRTFMMDYMWHTQNKSNVLQFPSYALPWIKRPASLLFSQQAAAAAAAAAASSTTTTSDTNPGNGVGITGIVGGNSSGSSNSNGTGTAEDIVVAAASASASASTNYNAISNSINSNQTISTTVTPTATLLSVAATNEIDSKSIGTFYNNSAFKPVINHHHQQQQQHHHHHQHQHQHHRSTTFSSATAAIAIGALMDSTTTTTTTAAEATGSTISTTLTNLSDEQRSLSRNSREDICTIKESISSDDEMVDIETTEEEQIHDEMKFKNSDSENATRIGIKIPESPTIEVENSDDMGWEDIMKKEGSARDLGNIRSTSTPLPSILSHSSSSSIISDHQSNGGGGGGCGTILASTGTGTSGINTGSCNGSNGVGNNGDLIGATNLDIAKVVTSNIVNVEQLGSTAAAAAVAIAAFGSQNNVSNSSIVGCINSSNSSNGGFGNAGSNNSLSNVPSISPPPPPSSIIPNNHHIPSSSSLSSNRTNLNSSNIVNNNNRNNLNNNSSSNNNNNNISINYNNNNFLTNHNHNTTTNGSELWSVARFSFDRPDYRIPFYRHDITKHFQTFRHGHETTTQANGIG